MSNLYGPYDREEWNTMLNLKEDIRFMKDSKQSKHSIPLDYTKKRLKEYIRKAA